MIGSGRSVRKITLETYFYFVLGREFYVVTEKNSPFHKYVANITKTMCGEEGR